LLTLELTLAERWGVSGNDDEFGLASTERLKSRLVSESNYRGSINIVDLSVRSAMLELGLTFSRLHN
jgi:hypothetical protein